MKPDPSTKERRRNVLWIFGDQHRGQMLGCMGDPNVNTPNIDRLSNTGVHFECAVAGTPVCTPFRGCLLTSRYAHECPPGEWGQLPPEMPTIAQAFREHDYHTAYFGKWHLDGAHRELQRHVVPPERRGGFNHWVGYENNNAPWDCWIHGSGIETPQRLPGFETDCLTDLFLDHLRLRAETPEEPFFAVLSVQPPHVPYAAPEEWMRRHHPSSMDLRPNVPRIPSVEPEARRDLAGAAALIGNLDWNLGRVLAELERTGLDDNTTIIFFSDHGDMHGSHGCFRKTVPWEESIRIPFIVGTAGGPLRRHGERPRAPINHVDIAPTTLGLCNIESPAWMRGFDYSGWFRRSGFDAEPPDSAFLQSLPSQGKTDEFTIESWRGLVTVDGWKYACVPHQPWMLFNLNDDPFELANLARSNKHRRKRKELHDRLQTWMKDTGDEFPLPPL